MKRLILTAMMVVACGATAKPLQVCVTLPDFADVVQVIGGEDVAVTTFVKGRDNPHFLEARPSFIKALSRADLLVLNGLDLEIGWLPLVIKGARNQQVSPGGAGHLDLGRTVRPKHDHGHGDYDHGPLDRAHGDVHPSGNPHYAVDPVYGLRFGEVIRDKLIELKPERETEFRQRHGEWAGRLGAALVGTALAAKYDAGKLGQLYEHGRLDAFLEKTGERQLLGGWFGELAPFAGTKVVVDHAGYLYLTDRYRLVTVDSLEPKPGVTPTTKHLRKVVETMQREKVAVILTTAYAPSRYAEYVAKKTGARIVNLAHQVGSRPGADSYFMACNYNVQMLRNGLGR